MEKKEQIYDLERTKVARILSLTATAEATNGK